MLRMRIFLVAAVAAVAVPLGGARAQQSKSQSADELVQRAQVLQSDPAAYAVAASLYEYSASFRSAGDARGAEALIMAGRLYGYAGEKPKALAAMKAGAERALADGDVPTAADAFADAAYLAAAQHDVQAVELARKVVELADAWMPEERSALLHRLGPTVVTALRNSPRELMVLALR